MDFISSNIYIILKIKAEDEAQQQSSKRKESSGESAEAAKGEETAALEEGDPPSKRPKLWLYEKEGNEVDQAVHGCIHRSRVFIYKASKVH